MAIDGKTQVLGIIGNNSLTLSPAIHNFSARYLGLNYVYVPLPRAELATMIKFFANSDIAGVNVTTPYKQEVARLLASDLLSVNTLYRHNDRLCVTSTDGQGFWQGLAHSKIDRRSIEEVVILGNGGLCLALLDYFAKHHYFKIYILARNHRSIERLPTVAGRCELLPLTAASLSQICATPAYRLLIQATNAPADVLRALCPAIDRLTGGVVDANYCPPSVIYHYARQRGIPVQDGLPMLIEQARLGQQLWWDGKCVPYDKIAEAIADL